MLRHLTLDHRFVDQIPEQLEPGVIYASMRYATAVHLCCCGCGREIVTPLSPTDWQLTFDGRSLSLHPSVGNWNVACRSHYIIRRGKVLEAAPWTDRQVDAERQRDRRAKTQFYTGAAPPPAPAPRTAGADPEPPKRELGLRGILGRLFHRR